ncbi:MAG: 1-acyl-sn-glycerol-3-phosphate acyltransferase [Tannerella sp.]|jgi:putative hemolysin|nr:1-acyl-sn-glycerol-3-phosphate acyltransferase [Tannerella sp.]
MNENDNKPTPDASVNRPIDVRKVLTQKAPRIAAKIPAFLVNRLCSLIHEDELNAIIVRNRHLDGVAFMQALVNDFGLTLQLHGEAHLPDTGRFIFASNHPLGGMDGICLAATVGERYNSKISYLVNDLLMFIPNLQSIFVPINKHGAQGRQAAAKIDEAFRSDRQIITFPAGLCSRRIKGKIADLKWHKSFIQKAVQYERDIVPVFFEGRNSAFFYRLANFRKLIGVKMNFEMLFLPDELFKNKNQTFGIYFGEPIAWQTFDKSKSSDEWASWVRDKVYKLKEINELCKK